MISKLYWLLMMMLFMMVLIPNAVAAMSISAEITASGGVVHVPVGNDGDGDYTADTKGCFDVIDAATPIVLNELKKQQQQDNYHKVYHIADYGTADAGTSLGLLTKMVQTVRTTDTTKPQQQIVIHYEDQWSNEWQSVFRHALGLKTVHDAYGNAIPVPFALGDVFPEATGIGFHNQCYPNDSIDFGISFTAMHWLSQQPNGFRGKQRIMHAAQIPTEQRIKSMESKIAAADWKDILVARSKELRPGGRFVCVNFCVTKDNEYLGRTDDGAVSMWDSFQTSWEMLHTKGMIDEDELSGISFPNYYRTKEEFLAGIEQVPSLKLVSYSERVVRCPYRNLYNPEKMTPEQYADWFVPTTRTWSHSTFASALHDHRDDKEAVLKQFWDNYKQLVAQAPEKHGMDYAHAYIVLEKVV